MKKARNRTWEDKTLTQLPVHLDLQIQHLKVRPSGKIEIGGSSYFVLVREDEEGITTLVCRYCIEGEAITVSFLGLKVTAAKRRACFQGKAIGGPDRSEAVLERVFWRSRLFLASAGAGNSNPEYGKQ
jgi:hypothetical protein